MQFLAKVFKPTRFSFCKNTQRALSPSSWLESNRGTIGSIVLEQQQNKRGLNLSKMYLVLTKQNSNSNESSTGFVITFFFHMLRLRFPQLNQGIFFNNPIGWYIACRGSHLNILSCAFLNVDQHCPIFHVAMSEQQGCIFKAYLSNCHGGAEVQSISERRLRSMQEASKLRKDSLWSNLPSFNQDNLVAHKNCLS